MSRIHTITYDQAKKWYDSGRKYKPAQVNDMFMAINDEDFTTMLPVLWLAACRNTSYYWHEPKWGEIGASYDWTGAFNRLVDSVREGLRNEQGAVEYVLDRPEE